MSVAVQNTPPCDAPLSLVYQDNAYFSNLAVPGNSLGAQDAGVQVSQLS